jgi:DNA-directed RNA polymerase subunit RPC12/RpoP
VYHLTAVKADIRRQDFSVCPRHWYIDATFRCRRCGKEFLFSAKEQQFRYEACRFYIDSVPGECATCRKILRDMEVLKQQYDREVTTPGDCHARFAAGRLGEGQRVRETLASVRGVFPSKTADSVGLAANDGLKPDLQNFITSAEERSVENIVVISPAGGAVRVCVDRG